MRFNVSQTRTGCPAGYYEAARLFSPGRDYSLREIVALGAAPEHIAWLLLTRAEHDIEVKQALSAGLQRCCDQIDVVRTADSQAVMLRLVQRFMRLNKATRHEAMAWVIDHIGA